MDGGAWWAAVHGIVKSWTRLSDFTFTFHFHALEKGMATHSSVLAWRIPGTGKPGGLPSMGSHRVGYDWSDLAAAAAAAGEGLGCFLQRNLFDWLSVSAATILNLEVGHPLLFWLTMMKTLAGSMYLGFRSVTLQILLPLAQRDDFSYSLLFSFQQP